MTKNPAHSRIFILFVIAEASAHVVQRGHPQCSQGACHTVYSVDSNRVRRICIVGGWGFVGSVLEESGR